MAETLTVVLANGAFPESEELLGMLRSARRLVCCDGAVNPLLAWRGRAPDVVVGDLDSMDPRARAEFPGAEFRRVREQDTNDLAKALRYCLRKGWRDVAILGAAGRREDHFLGNLGHLADFSEKLPRLRMETDEGTFSVVRGEGVVPTAPGRSVSFIAFDPEVRVTADGVVYPVEDLRLGSLWTATLNVCTGAEVRVRTRRAGAESPPLVLVYLARRGRGPEDAR